MSFFKKLFSSHSQEKFEFENHIEKIEETLIAADMGVDTTLEILKILKKNKKSFKSENDMISFIKQYLESILQSLTAPSFTDDSTKAILFFGINGVGKTTTLAKLANLYKKQNKTILLSAADTFRAGAIKQLEIWADQIKVPIIKSKPMADSGSVVFNSLTMAISKKIEFVLIDTAGRMHTNNDLLRELKKIETIILKKLPLENLKRIMIIDAQTGQNAFDQILKFKNLFQIDSLIMTKLDSGAKGGTIIKIMKELKIPIEYIGTGENINDLLLFDPKKYLDEIF